MEIGIIGTGGMGTAIGNILAKAGHSVALSFSRDSTKLDAAAIAAGQNARATSVKEAAMADVVFLTVPFASLDAALSEGGNLAGKTLISCVSGLRPDFTGEAVGIATSLTTSVAEIIAERTGAEVVETFNMTFAEILASDTRDFGGERPGMPLCGDGANAKAVAAALIKECGYDPIDCGSLVVARSLETFASIWVQTAVVSGLFPQIGLKFLRRAEESRR